MLDCYISCTILKPIHYHSVPDFNLVCNILHTLLQPGRQTQQFSYISQEEQWQKYLNPLKAELNPICHLLILVAAHHILYFSRIRVKSVVPVHKVFLVWTDRPNLWPR